MEWQENNNHIEAEENGRKWIMAKKCKKKTKVGLRVRPAAGRTKKAENEQKKSRKIRLT